MRKSHYIRPDPREQMQLMERDRTFLSWLFQTGLTKATAASLLWLAGADRDAVGFMKRLQQFHRSGYLCRFHPGNNPTMEGNARPDCIALEYGSAGVVIDGRKPLDTLEHATVDRLYALAEADRTRLLELLASFPADLVERRLKNASDQIKNILAGSKSATHDLLTSDFLALAIFTAARSNGRLAISDIALDDEVLLKATVTEIDTATRRETTKKLLRKPDAVVVVVQDGTRIAFLLEAETGTSAKHKIVTKLSEYRRIKQHYESRGGKQAWHQAVADAAGTAPIDAVRIVFYCATQAHVETVTKAIREVFGDDPAGMVIIVPKSHVHLEDKARDVYGNTRRSDGIRTLTHIASRLLAPVCTVVTKTGTRLDPLFDLSPIQ
jgi:hypothetical protein